MQIANVLLGVDSAAVVLLIEGVAVVRSVDAVVVRAVAVVVRTAALLVCVALASVCVAFTIRAAISACIVGELHVFWSLVSLCP